MKKLIIYLSSILFLFGVSVAFAGVYIEDFEDGVLGEWLSSTSGDYEIIPDPVGGSMVLHMKRSTCDDCGGFTQVGTDTNELIYHFAADIYLSNSNPAADMDIFQWQEDTIVFWPGIYLNGATGNLEVFVGLYDSDGQWIHLTETSGAYYVEAWYSLSITINDGYVTFGINGNETNLYHELIRPSGSSHCGARFQVFSNDPENGDVDYSVDNLALYTSTDPTKNNLLAFFDDSVEAVLIEGSGNNPRLANRRLSLFRQMLERAISFIENDMIEAAYRTLNRVLLFCDGEPHPPDYIEGEGVPQLRGMIEHLMAPFTDDDGDGLSENQGDCNDTDDTIYPGAPEICDSQDNQCPGDSGYGTVDEGCLTDVQVGGYSVYQCWDPEYYILFQALDPNNVADSVTVTGPGIDGSWPLFFDGYDNWSTPSFFSLGQSLPVPPPLTYTFHIESSGTIYPIDFILQSFNEECVTNLSPTGFASGDITFSWTGISSSGARYFVELNDDAGFQIWQSASTEDTSIAYIGPPLSLGSSYSFVVWAQDSFGNYSTAMAEFVYEPPPP